MNIIGISAFYHESACCLLQDATLVAAASEERFSRVKHDPRLPIHAFRYCLNAGSVGLPDVDCIAFYESPVQKLSRQLWSGIPEGDAGDLTWMDPGRPERAIRERLGYEGPILFFEHHRSHAASAFFYSGFRKAAILTIDGVGEWATTAYGAGDEREIDLFEQVHFPHSLGLLYATLTAYLGFRVNDGEYKVMGLAPYGKPRFVEHMRRLLRSLPRGQYRLALDYFNFVRGRTMYSPRLCDLFGNPAREPGAEITQFHSDVARSLQVVLEEVLLEKVNYLSTRVASSNLCLAGGVALNCTAMGRIAREGPFKRLFIQPAAGDAGGSLGAAALAHAELIGKRHSERPLEHVHLGPSWSPAEVVSLLDETGLRPHDFRSAEAKLLEAVVDRLVDGKAVGWFQGAMELGPRALGAPSILANPMDPCIRDRLNRLIKRRESFRPFAPSVPTARAADHFALGDTSPFMLQTCQVVSRLELPAITHVDGSARPQTVDGKHNPRFAALLEAFHRRTGCPILLNTSLNMRDEPIVCSPFEALRFMALSGLDALVLEDFVIDREMLPSNWQDLLLSMNRVRNGEPAQGESAIRENLYTFA